MVTTFNSFILLAFTTSKNISLSLAIVIMMLFSVSVSAAQIDASVDRNPITLSDSFQLTFTATVSPDGDPNFSPLKQDFDIINQQKNSQLSWVNGSTNRTIQWTLTVMAKRVGELTIPAISFGDDASSPLSIKVIETAPLSALSQDDDLYLEVEASPKQAYVQAQVLYTVRLYQRINLAQATLSDPKLENTIIEKLGEDNQYNTKVKGVNYLVTERKYALFPQQSGTMTIAPLVLNADVITQDPRSRFDSFFSNQRTQTKRVLSKAITLNVQPSPDNDKASHWLPAEQVQLKETWSNKELKVNVGEPITRTLTITAKGTTSSQLPDLANTELNSQLKIYPDKAVINDQKNTTGIVATREQKLAFIPQIAGNFDLPAIEVPWFNTKTQQMETAQLPAVRLMAIATPQATTSTNNAVASNPTITATTTTAEVSPLQENTSVTNSNPLWKWTTLGFALAWLLTIIALFRTRIAKPHAQIKMDTPGAPAKLKEITQTLKKACIDNDPHAAQKALIKWSTAKYNVSSLAVLNHHCDVKLQAELNKLNQALYAKETSAWDGSTLWQAISTHQLMQSPSKREGEPLLPLHPSQR